MGGIKGTAEMIGKTVPAVKLIVNRIDEIVRALWQKTQLGKDMATIELAKKEKAGIQKQIDQINRNTAGVSKDTHFNSLESTLKKGSDTGSYKRESGYDPQASTQINRWAQDRGHGDNPLLGGGLNE